jgi:23S rRNA G2445 N2-methylase RlmL
MAGSGTTNVEAALMELIQLQLMLALLSIHD